jgi:hypothetical protein
VSEKTPYWELLKDPRWLKRRDQIITLFGRVCWQCKATEGAMHVHHRYYISKRLPWDYPDVALRVLCEECHQWKHDQPNRLEDWEMFLSECFQVAMAHCQGRTEKVVFQAIARHVIQMRVEPREISEKDKNDHGWILEFNPREGHPFHVDRMEWAQEYYLKDAIKGRENPWRPVAFNLTHGEAQELADKLLIIWKERGQERRSE